MLSRSVELLVVRQATGSELSSEVVAGDGELALSPDCQHFPDWMMVRHEHSSPLLEPVAQEPGEDVEIDWRIGSKTRSNTTPVAAAWTNFSPMSIAQS